MPSPSTSFLPRPLRTVLGVASLSALLLALASQAPGQADQIRTRAQQQAAERLAAAGYPWVRLHIEGDVGRLDGMAPSDAARQRALQAARYLLAPQMGWPGVYARLQDAQQVAGQPPVALTLAASLAVEQVRAAPRLAPPAQDGRAGCAARLQQAQGGDRIQFDSGATEPTAASQALLGRLAIVVQGCPGLTLSVQGHTDALGASEHNQRLSLRRAEAVAAALQAQGLAAPRLQTVGLGASELLDPSATPQAHRRNRRIEFHWTVASR